MFVVAGANGHVGSVIAEELLRHGQRVRAIVRDLAKPSSWAKMGAEVAVTPLDDASGLARTLAGASGFFVLLPAPYHASSFFDEQRRMADAIIHAARQSAVPHVVVLSSLGADLGEGTGPAKGLHYLENGLRAAGRRVTALRAAPFQENVGNALGPARSAGTYFNYSTSADHPVPMVATRDIGLLAAHELMFSSPGSEAVDLLGPTYSVRAQAEILGRALGRLLHVVDVPPSDHVAHLMKSGLPKSTAETLAELSAALASGLIQPRGDRTKIAGTKLEDTVQAIVQDKPYR